MKSYTRAVCNVSEINISGGAVVSFESVNCEFKSFTPAHHSDCFYLCRVSYVQILTSKLYPVELDH